MFTDLVGFSQLSDQNEKKALELLEEHRKLLRAEFGKFNGTEVKTMGDGFLIEYPSSLDSVNCAISIQKSLDLYNTTREDEDRIKLRIGLHLGDIEKSEDDVHGDGVNIASRIEPFSEPGGICVSSQIYDQVNNKIKFNIDSIGEKKLKNIAKPMELFSVNLPWRKSTLKNVGERAVENSIAVMPFLNMSSDKENEYFCDGITEELLNVFAKEKDLKVISRTSSFTYKGKDIPLRQIGEELGVENVLEGSVRKSGERVRITAQLIRAADDFHLWTETYDRTIDDIFALQDEIAGTILSELLHKIVDVDSKDDAGKSKNVDAYNIYLEGVFLWNKRDKKSLEKAIKKFEEAASIDDTFSLPYTQIADSYLLLIFFYDKYSIEGSEIIEDLKKKGQKAINRAKSMGDVSSELYTSQSLLLDIDNKIDEAIDYQKTAIEKNPNYATAYQRLGVLYGQMGDYEKSTETIEIAASLDPKSLVIQYSLGGEYQFIENFEKSIDCFKKIYNESPFYNSVLSELASSYRMLKKWKKAEEIYSTHIKKILNPEELTISHKSYSYLLMDMKHLYLITNNKKRYNEISSLWNKITDYSNIEEVANLVDDLDNSGEYKKALDLVDKTLSNITLKDSDDDAVLICRAEYANIHFGNYEVALEARKKVESREHDNNDPSCEFFAGDKVLTLQGLSYIHKGDIENGYLTINKMKESYDKFEKRNPHYGDTEFIRCNSYLGLCKMYIAIGNLDKSFEYINLILKNKTNYLDSQIISNAHIDKFKLLRKDPRYIDVLKELKLYDYWKDDPEIKKLEKGK